MSTDLQGKNIIVTGASSGIGRQCAIELSRRGASVILMARDEGRLRDTLSAMDNPERHTICPIDITRYADVEATVADCVQKTGRLSGVVNCAGVSATLPFKLCTPEKLEDIFRTNVFGAFNLTRIACKMGHFSKEGGCIIFIASVMAHAGEKGKSMYAASKGALLACAKSLAAELAPKRIRVNTISPGCIVTPINSSLPHIADPDKRAVLESKHPLGLGETADVAAACAFLLSDGAKWITGADLPVDGGYLSL